MSNAPESPAPWTGSIGPLTHELRQEVSAVLHQVDLLKTSALDEMTRRRSLAAIEDNAESLMAFVDDLVGLDRVERGGVTPSCRPVEVDELISAVGLDRVRRVQWTTPRDRSGKRWSTHTDPLLIDQVITGVLGRYHRDGLDAEAVVSVFALRSTDRFIDVVFTADRSRPIETAQFRPATLDDGLALYLARRTAELVGASVGVLRSGRRGSYLLRLPEAPSAATR